MEERNETESRRCELGDRRAARAVIEAVKEWRVADKAFDLSDTSTQYELSRKIRALEAAADALIKPEAA